MYITYKLITKEKHLNSNWQKKNPREHYLFSSVYYLLSCATWQPP